MADDQQLSKRQRKKQQRRARAEAEAARTARRRKRRVTALMVLAVVVVTGGGYLVQQGMADRAERTERLERAADPDRLDELGCTADERVDVDDDLVRIAADDPDAQAASPPDEVFATTPGTGGARIDAHVLSTGVYDAPVDERLAGGNLAHGYVVIWHDPDAPGATVDDLTGQVAGWLADETYDRLVVAPYHEALPDDAVVALTAWGRIQLCEQVDPDVVERFVDAHHGTSGEAPDPRRGPHVGRGLGELEPDDAPVLLPPLGDDRLDR